MSRSSHERPKPGTTVIQLFCHGNCASVELVGSNSIALISFDVSLKDQSLHLTCWLVIDAKHGRCRIKISHGFCPIRLLGLEPAAGEEGRSLTDAVFGLAVQGQALLERRQGSTPLSPFLQDLTLSQ